MDQPDFDSLFRQMCERWPWDPADQKVALDYRRRLWAVASGLDERRARALRDAVEDALGDKYQRYRPSVAHFAESVRATDHEFAASGEIPKVESDQCERTAEWAHGMAEEFRRRLRDQPVHTARALRPMSLEEWQEHIEKTDPERAEHYRRRRAELARLERIGNAAPPSSPPADAPTNLLEACATFRGGRASEPEPIGKIVEQVVDEAEERRARVVRATGEYMEGKR